MKGNRVKELRWVLGRELLANVKNWRVHGAVQREMLRRVLAEVGFAGALLARETAGGKLELLDGHLRAEELADEQLPVVVVELSDGEAELVLATHDPLASLADVDVGKWKALNGEMDAAWQGLLQELSAGVPQLAELKLDAWGDVEPMVELPECFDVLVECKCEAEQRAVYEAEVAQGRKCRLLGMRGVR